MLVYFFFFFSSRRRHTRCSRDWSSDVCSSDLFVGRGEPRRDLALSRADGEFRVASHDRQEGPGPGGDGHGGGPRKFLARHGKKFFQKCVGHYLTPPPHDGRLHPAEAKPAPTDPPKPG